MVAERRMADLAVVEAVERTVQPGLPLPTRIEELLLIAGSEAPRSWRILRRLPLA